MKKLMRLVTLAVVASVVAASAQEVLSANAVGYVKRTVPAGGLQIVSIPFDNIANETGAYTFGETQVSGDMPAGMGRGGGRGRNAQGSGKYRAGSGRAARV